MGKEKSTKKDRICFIGHDSDTVEFFKVFLEGDGYEVLSLVVGQADSAHVSDFCPDLVILDLYLYSDLDLSFYRSSEYQLLQQLRSCKETTRIPLIVVLTLERFAKDLERVLDEDIREVVVKPLDMNKFLAKVRKVVSSK
ncbi:MAG: hypothetical protein M1150_01245 [Patescibacteria group bacterium]|nr:hypothetical protein [Patescibacteria group bacterium]